MNLKGSTNDQKRFRYTGKAGTTAVSNLLYANKEKQPLPISANLVKLHPNEPAIICMQCPTPSVFGDTWAVMLQENVTCIVDLTSKADSKNKKSGVYHAAKVHRYYPNKVGRSITYQSASGDVTVTLQSQQLVGSHQTMSLQTFTVRKNQGVLTSIKRLHCDSWRDRGAISPQQLSLLINEADKVAEFGQIAVHCSAGVGRTGTFATARTLKHLYSSPPASLKQATEQLRPLLEAGRKGRGPLFVQTTEQMKSLYQLMFELGLEK